MLPSKRWWTIRNCVRSWRFPRSLKWILSAPRVIHQTSMPSSHLHPAPTRGRSVANAAGIRTKIWSSVAFLTTQVHVWYFISVCATTQISVKGHEMHIITWCSVGCIYPFSSRKCTQHPYYRKGKQIALKNRVRFAQSMFPACCCFNDCSLSLQEKRWCFADPPREFCGHTHSRAVQTRGDVAGRHSGLEPGLVLFWLWGGPGRGQRGGERWRW